MYGCILSEVISLCSFLLFDLFIFFLFFIFFFFFFLFVFFFFFFFFSSRRRHTRLVSDWSSDVCSSDLFGTFRALLGGGAVWAALPSQLTGTVVANRLCRDFPCRVDSRYWNVGVAVLRRRRGQVESSGRHLRSEEHTSELQSLTNLVCRL